MTSLTAVSTASTETPIVALILDGGLPAIPSDVLKRIQSKSYLELCELLPERTEGALIPPITGGGIWSPPFLRQLAGLDQLSCFHCAKRPHLLSLIHI